MNREALEDIARTAEWLTLFARLSRLARTALPAEELAAHLRGIDDALLDRQAVLVMRGARELAQVARLAEAPVQGRPN